jgi:hypothetical protein
MSIMDSKPIPPGENLNSTKLFLNVKPFDGSTTVCASIATAIKRFSSITKSVKVVLI